MSFRFKYGGIRMDEKLELTYDRLKEKELEEVAKLYDAERPITTNRVKMKQTFAKIKDNSDY